MIQWLEERHRSNHIGGRIGQSREPEEKAMTCYCEIHGPVDCLDGCPYCEIMNDDNDGEGAAV